jgi:hypothetical protein
LVSAGGVDGEGSDEGPVNEDVAAGAGHDGECRLTVVGGADADAVLEAEVDPSAVEVSGVDAGGGAERPVGGAALGGVDPDVGGVAAVKGPVGRWWL